MLALTLLVMGTATAQGDVTGSLGAHVGVVTFEEQVAETGPLLFDVETDLTATVALSGLSSTLHSHLGLAGLEDAIVRGKATLGAFELQSHIVFARFAYGAIEPFYALPHFLEQRLQLTTSLGGVNVTAHAAFMDTLAFVSPSPAYAFGTVLRTQGQTPSGVTVRAETGLCMEQAQQRIKKHPELGPYSVNPHCATEPKPLLLFDFEKFSVEGIPVAPGATLDHTVTCLTGSACALKGRLHLDRGPIPLEVAFRFPDLFGLSFEGARLSVPLDPISLSLVINAEAAIAAAIADASWTLNPDTRPATVDARLEVVPGLGVADVDGDGIAATFALTLQRPRLSYGARLNVGNGTPAGFKSLHVRARADLALGELTAATSFALSGLDEASLDFRLPF